MLPLDGIRRLIDAGGGNGTVASMIVNTHKEVNVIVLDRPEVLSFFASDTGADSRITRHSGDIFLPWNIKGDAVLLARVLHDWNDARAAIILRNARGALHAGGPPLCCGIIETKYDRGRIMLLEHTGGKRRS